MSDQTYIRLVPASDKPIVWLAGEIRTPPFSREARIEAGVLLRMLQRGELLMLPHSRPVPSIGKRCHELRIVDEYHSWRIVYRHEPDAVLVLEVFSKRTRKMPRQVIESCKRRLAAYLAIAGED